jgi:hypothetical protein
MKRSLTSTALVFAFFAAELSAQTLTFAEFAPAQPAQKAFVFDDDETSHHSNSATFDTANFFTGIKVNFEFNPALVFTGALAALNGPQHAYFFMQSTADDIKAGGGSETFLDSGVMEFLLAKPVDGENLLLKVAFSNAAVVVDNATGAEVALANPLGGSSITYSSDFLDFNSSIPDDWGISLNDVDSVFCDPDFSASSAGGIFQGDPAPIPEPKTYGLIASLITLAAVLPQRRWRTIPPAAIL